MRRLLSFIHFMQLFAFLVVKGVVEVLKFGLGRSLLEELDKVLLRFVIPLALVPLRFVHEAH